MDKEINTSADKQQIISKDPSNQSMPQQNSVSEIQKPENPSNTKTGSIISQDRMGIQKRKLIMRFYWCLGGLIAVIITEVSMLRIKPGDRGESGWGMIIFLPIWIADAFFLPLFIHSFALTLKNSNAQDKARAVTKFLILFSLMLVAIVLYSFSFYK